MTRKAHAGLLIATLSLAASIGFAQESPPSPDASLRERAIARWKQLPEARRKELLRRYEQYKALPPEARERIRANLEKFERMSPEQRQEFRKKLAAMDPQDRRALLRRTLGVAHAPQGKQRVVHGLCHMLGGLSEDERQQLKGLEGPERMHHVRSLLERKFAQQFLTTPEQQATFRTATPEQRAQMMRDMLRQHFKQLGPHRPGHEGGRPHRDWRDRHPRDRHPPDDDDD